MESLKRLIPKAGWFEMKTKKMAMGGMGGPMGRGPGGPMGRGPGGAMTPAPAAMPALSQSSLVQGMTPAPTGGEIQPIMRKKGGSVSASSRADGCAQRGKTRGKMV
jgi:hypothetical protein